MEQTFLGVKQDFSGLFDHMTFPIPPLKAKSGLSATKQFSVHAYSQFTQCHSQCRLLTKLQQKVFLADSETNNDNYTGVTKVPSKVDICRQ